MKFQVCTLSRIENYVNKSAAEVKDSIKCADNFLLKFFVHILRKIRVHVIFYRWHYVRYRTDGSVRIS